MAASSAATRCRLYWLVRPYKRVDKRVTFAYFLGVPHDFQAGQQFHITCWPASLHVPNTLRLVGRVIFRPVLGQSAFCRMLVIQAGLLVPPSHDGEPDGSIAGWGKVNLGGSSATATATCNPSNRDAMAIVLSTDIVFPLVLAASAIPGIVAFGTTMQDYSNEGRKCEEPPGLWVHQMQGNFASTLNSVRTRAHHAGMVANSRRTANSRQPRRLMRLP
jgi:hypothetical protein